MNTHDILLELMGADIDPRILYQPFVKAAQTRDLSDAPKAASETHPVR